MTFFLHLLMRTIHLNRRIVVERRALQTAVFPAVAAVEKRAAPGHAPVVVQRPDQRDVRFVRLDALAEINNLRQVQPVAVHDVKMQHHWPLGAGHLAIKVIQVAKQVAVKQAKQRQVCYRRQTRGLFYHLRITLVADALFAALAIAVDKLRGQPLTQRALMQVQRHARRAAFSKTHVKLQNIHLITFTRAFSPTTSAWSGISSSTTLPAPIVT